MSMRVGNEAGNPLRKSATAPLEATPSPQTPQLTQTTQASQTSQASQTDALNRAIETAAKNPDAAIDQTTARLASVEKLKATFKEAVGREPKTNEIERYLSIAELRGLDGAIQRIKSSDEAAMVKYGAKVKETVEKVAAELRAQGNLDEERFSSTLSNESRLSLFASALMDGQNATAIEDKIRQNLKRFTPKAESIGKDFDWEVQDRPIQGTTFSSVGDPHEKTGDGKAFDNYAEGEFVKLASQSGDFMLQTRQTKITSSVTGIYNTAAGMKLGTDVVEYEATGKRDGLKVNGQPVALKEGEEKTLPGGGLVRRLKNASLTVARYEMVSPKGDKVAIQDYGKYLNLNGEVSSQRKDGEIRGSLGTFDNDTSATNDLLGRKGNQPMAVKDFIEEWRVKPAERIFGIQSKPTSYTVEKGDTLWKIAQKLLGQGTRWRELYELNKDVIQNPNELASGVLLKLPKE